MSFTDLRTFAEGVRNLADAEEDSVNATIVGASIAVPMDKQSILRQLVTLTTTNLGITATFTGPTVDAIQAKRITGVAASDQAGTLHVEQSDDATNWNRYTLVAVNGSDATDPDVDVAIGGVSGFDFPCLQRYVRLVYVNGAVAQASFRLSGYLSAE